MSSILSAPHFHNEEAARAIEADGGLSPTEAAKALEKVMGNAKRPKEC